jgi:hypothetical protein
VSSSKPLPQQIGGVDLGLAGNFVILSKSGITEASPSTGTVSGNIGTSPITGASITGVTCAEVTGTIYTVDAAGPACRVIDAKRLRSAVHNMETAYTDAAARSSSGAAFKNIGAGTIGSTTPSFTPGVYTWGTALSITGNITISGGPNDVWIFQVAGTLNMSSAKQIILSGGAQAKNIFWQTSGAVTLRSTSHFEGVILGKTGINMQNGASINGRLLAQTAATLIGNAVTQP